MDRIPTTLMLSAWLGYAGVSTAGVLAEPALAPAGLALVLPLGAAVTGGVALSILELHSKESAQNAVGERLAWVTAVCGFFFVLATTGAEAGLVAFAVSAAAILFDRLVTTDRDDTSDADFEEAVKLIAGGLAMQTRWHTPAHSIVNEETER